MMSLKLPDRSYSVSDIKNYIKYIMIEHEALPINPPIHIYINTIKNRNGMEIEIELQW